MARITTEDCERIVPNRFALVLLAAQRARELEAGAEPQIEARNEPSTLLALREIAAGKVEIDRLSKRLIECFSDVDEDMSALSRPSREQFVPIAEPDGRTDPTGGAMLAMSA